MRLDFFPLFLKFLTAHNIIRKSPKNCEVTLECKKKTGLNIESKSYRAHAISR